MLNHPWRKPLPIHAGSSKFPDVGPVGHVASAPPAADRTVLERYVAQHSADWDKLDRERSMARNRQAPAEPGSNRLPPLSTVPQVFFSGDFDLGNPYIFDLVTERYKQTTALGAESDPDTLQYGVVLNQMLQEKLSYYLDVIEQHLVVEIGAKSASFFDALSTLQQLRVDAHDCLTHMDGVSAQLDAVEAHVQDGLDLAQLQEERRALEAQHDLLLKVQRLLDRRHLVALSVQHGEYDSAMTTMEDIRQALQTDSEFQGVASLRALLPELDEEQAKMARELQHVLAELMDAVAVPRAALQAVDVSVCVPPMPLDEVLSTSVAPLAEPASAWEPVWDLLQRCSGLDAALDAYAERIGQLVLDGVAERLGAYAPASWAVPSATNEQRTAPAWDDYVPGLAALLYVLWRVAQHIQHVHTMWTARASHAQAQRLAHATRSMWAAIERSIVHVMTPRHAQLSSMPWDTFVVYHALVWRFVHLAESEAGRPGVALRSCVLTQAKAYLGTQHRQRIERAMRAVEDEVWAPAPVSPELQATMQRLQDAAHGEVAVYLVELALGGASPAVPAAQGEAVRQLTLDNTPFFVVKAAGTVLSLLDDYVRLVVNLPLFAAETLGWVVELLKQFNSRTCQVVLGAGAMRSAGLKNITARHLALAAQTLSLMMALLPSLRALMKRHLTTSQVVLLGDFDKLQRDFREHQFEIHAKLVAIMGDRVHVHCRAMAQVDLGAGSGPSAPIADLVRETGTLYRVMSQYLEPSVVEASVAQVARDIDTRMAVAVSAVDVRSTEAHKRLLGDLEFLGEKMKVMYPAWQGEQLQQAAKGKTPKPQLEMRRPTGEPLGYRPRRSLGKRPPSTQSPQLESMEAFQQPAAKEPEVPPVPAKNEGHTAPAEKAEAAKAESSKAEDAKAEPPKAEEAKAEPPKAEEAKAEPPKAEDAKVEPPKAEEVKDEEAKDESAGHAATEIQAEPKATPTVAPAAPAEATGATARLSLETSLVSTPNTRPETRAVTDAPAASPVSPTKEGRRPRVSLEQRLAEAAKRRGMQRSSPVPSPGPPSPEKPTARKLSLAERLAGAAKTEARASEPARGEQAAQDRDRPARPSHEPVPAESLVGPSLSEDGQAASVPEEANVAQPEAPKTELGPNEAITTETVAETADAAPAKAEPMPETHETVAGKTEGEADRSMPVREGNAPIATSTEAPRHDAAELVARDQAQAPATETSNTETKAPAASETNSNEQESASQGPAVTAASMDTKETGAD